MGQPDKHVLWYKCQRCSLLFPVEVLIMFRWESPPPHHWHHCTRTQLGMANYVGYDEPNEEEDPR